jgi:hypothetical protein
MDERKPYIHQITNFESYSDEEPIVLTVDKNIIGEWNYGY